MSRKNIFFALVCFAIVFSSGTVLSVDSYAFNGRDSFNSLLLAESGPRTVPPPRTVPLPVTVTSPRTVPPPVTVTSPRTVPPPVPLSGISLPSKTTGGEPEFSGLSAAEQQGLLDAIRRFSQGDHTALSDIMKFTENIPEGWYVFAQGSGGIGVGVSGAQIKVDFLSAGLKIKKNHDGSVEIEVAGQLGVTPEAEAGSGGSVGGGLRAGSSIKISKDGQRITIGQKIGAGVGGEGTAKTPGVGVFVKLGVDVSAMGGWELEMSVETYSQLSPFERNLMTNPASAAFLAGFDEDIGLYVTTDVKGSYGGSGGGHGGAGWGPQGGFEVGVGYESEGTNIIPKGWERIKLLWYWKNGQYHPYSIIIVRIDYNQLEVTA